MQSLALTSPVPPDLGAGIAPGERLSEPISPLAAAQAVRVLSRSEQCMSVPPGESVSESEITLSASSCVEARLGTLVALS